ncbi:hypothetical protein BH11MYX1_BH11MYX1_05710 [soil metagenome]
MAKRSPILGYNHNVRYRGLVFHVQTEDSGVMSPHLFTHLFHGGVIISTRKLVYDGSASEEAIKSLMQSQHKAVLRDLKIHTFDDKIDVYLANVEGLEPREVAAGLRVSDPEITIEPGLESGGRAGTDPGAPPIEQLELMPPAVAEPVALPPSAERTMAIPPAEGQVVAKPRTQTAERTSKSSQFRSLPPPVTHADASSGSTGAPAAEVHTAATVPTAQRGIRPPAPPTQRSQTPPPIPDRATGVPQSRTSIPLSTDSQPEIEIIQHEPGESGRIRTPRDTTVDNSYDDGVPSAIGPDNTIPSDGIPPRLAEAQQSTRMANPSRPPSHGAATLPAVRQPARPAIIAPSVVVSRPLPTEAQRNRGDSEAVEIYAPAPGSAEPPPGERSERPGQYSMNRRRDVASHESPPLRELTGRFAVPAGLTPPRRAPTQAQSSQSGPARTSAPSTSPIPSVPQPQARSPQSDGVPRPPTMPPSDGIPQAPDGGRTQPPPRPPHLTAPISSRTATGSTSSGAHSSGNVVMSRPSVIVGAPAKLPGTPAPKVRKAREEEGRGFGQGLISEKSLDEVILAYLSEDADEK